MKIAIVFDIAPFSTKDVGLGLVRGFTDLGHEAVSVPLDIYSGALTNKHTEETKLDPTFIREVFQMVNYTLLGQLIFNPPDAVLVVTGKFVSSQTVKKIKEVLRCPVMLYLTESPYDDQKQLEWVSPYDFVFCNEKTSVEKYRAQHPRTYYLPHSYNPEIHYPRNDDSYLYPEVFFAGSGSEERVKTLLSLDLKKLDLALYGHWRKAQDTELIKYVEGGILPNEEAARYYSNSGINLNFHREDAGAESANPRVFEVLACGGFLLTDFRAEVAELFQDGKDLVICHGPEDLEEKLHFYVERPKERQKIAASGRAAVLKYRHSSRIAEYIVPRLEESFCLTMVKK